MTWLQKICHSWLSLQASPLSVPLNHDSLGPDLRMTIWHENCWRNKIINLLLSYHFSHCCPLFSTNMRPSHVPLVPATTLCVYSPPPLYCTCAVRAAQWLAWKGSTNFFPVFHLLLELTPRSACHTSTASIYIKTEKRARNRLLYSCTVLVSPKPQNCSILSQNPNMIGEQPIQHFV